MADPSSQVIATFFGACANQEKFPKAKEDCAKECISYKPDSVEALKDEKCILSLEKSEDFCN